MIEIKNLLMEGMSDQSGSENLKYGNQRKMSMDKEGSNINPLESPKFGQEKSLREPLLGGIHGGARDGTCIIKGSSNLHNAINQTRCILPSPSYVNMNINTPSDDLGKLTSPSDNETSPTLSDNRRMTHENFITLGNNDIDVVNNNNCKSKDGIPDKEKKSSTLLGGSLFSKEKKSSSSENNDPPNKVIHTGDFHHQEIMFEAASANYVDEVRNLLDKGYDVNVSDYDNRTLLHVSCSFGYYDMVKMLIDEYDAKINVIDAKGNTPLYDALKYAISSKSFKRLNYTNNSHHTHHIGYGNYSDFMRRQSFFSDKDKRHSQRDFKIGANNAQNQKLKTHINGSK